MNLAAIIWDVSSDFLVFTESYAVRWYGILFSLGYVLGYFILTYAFKQEKIPLLVLEKLTIATLLGGVVGARLGHCLFYEPLLYLHNPFRILYIWEGGLASHGGAVGVLCGIYLVARKQSLSFSTFLSRAMLVVPLTGALIRIGNLMNSEIYGIETDLPWGFIFVKSADVIAGMEHALPRHPTQIYEAICYLLLFVYLQVYYWRKIRFSLQISERYIAGVFLLGIFATRFGIEFLKQNQVSFENAMVLNMGQLLSIPFILWGVWLLYQHVKITKQAAA